MHERRLAGPGRAHHGGELAALDAERDAAQRVNGPVALAVATDEVVGDDGGVGRLRSRRQRLRAHLDDVDVVAGGVDQPLHLVQAHALVDDVRPAPLARLGRAHRQSQELLDHGL